MQKRRPNEATGDDEFKRQQERHGTATKAEAVNRRTRFGRRSPPRAAKIILSPTRFLTWTSDTLALNLGTAMPLLPPSSATLVQPCGWALRPPPPPPASPIDDESSRERQTSKTQIHSTAF